MKNEYAMEELLPLLSDLARKCTGNESSSITYDKALKLMNSILYCLEEEDNGEETDNYSVVYQKISPVAAYEKGLIQKRNKIEMAKKLYEDIMKNFDSYGNQAYYDTVVKGMPAFFQRYDVRFDAANHILTLDYPLLNEIKGLNGIDLIYEYLKRIQLEQTILKPFSPEAVRTVLLGFHEDHSELIFNICKNIIRNAIGCILTGKSPLELILDEQERKQLKNIAMTKTEEELRMLLNNSLEVLTQTVYGGNPAVSDYLKTDLKEFAYEYRFRSDKDGFKHFFSGIIETVPDSTTTTWFEDGVMMENEALRKLIDEMKECRYLSDKLAMLKENVKSIADLKEVMEECFFGEEQGEVLSLLSEEERRILTFYNK